jgi:hypothetical protein
MDLRIGDVSLRVSIYAVAHHHYMDLHFQVMSWAVRLHLIIGPTLHMLYTYMHESYKCEGRKANIFDCIVDKFTTVDGSLNLYLFCENLALRCCKVLNSTSRNTSQRYYNQSTWSNPSVSHFYFKKDRQAHHDEAPAIVRVDDKLIA